MTQFHKFFLLSARPPLSNYRSSSTEITSKRLLSSRNHNTIELENVTDSIWILCTVIFVFLAPESIEIETPDIFQWGSVISLTQRLNISKIAKHPNGQFRRKEEKNNILYIACWIVPMASEYTCSNKIEQIEIIHYIRTYFANFMSAGQQWKGLANTIY